MDIRPLDDELKDVLERARARALSDESILRQARRVGLGLPDLEALLDVPEEELLEPCRSSLTDFRRADDELQQYREDVRLRVAERPPLASEDPDQPSASSSRREERSRRTVKRALDATLDRDHRWIALQQRREAALEVFRESLLEMGMMPRLRVAINLRQREMTATAEARRERFREPLCSVDTRGLRQRADQKTMVATRASAELEALTDPEQSRRVSVGVAGPRGSGKSTLLANIVDRWQGGVRILVPAPTSYVPREFLLYLYDRVCQQVIDPAGDPTGQGVDDSASPRAVPPARLAAASLLTLVLAPGLVIAVGIALLISAHAARVRAGGQGLHSLGGALLVLTIVPPALYFLQHRESRQSLSSSSETETAGTLLLIYNLPRWQLPSMNRVLPCLALAGAALFVAAEGDRWGITLRQTLGVTLVVAAAATSVFWHLGPAVPLPPRPEEPSVSGLLDQARRLVLMVSIAAAQVAAFVVGIAMLLPAALLAIDTPLVIGCILIAGGASGLAVGLRSRRLLQHESHALDAPPSDLFVQRATLARGRIRYQRTLQSGWSSSVKVSAPSWFGVDAGLSGQTSEAEAPMSIPEIVDSVKHFLPLRGPALVAIDELDKVESVEKAREFLNEIKGVLEAPDTRFLVSMSEDAIASFERRGLPFRDVFDSAFDEVVSVPYLSLQEATDVLNRRITDVPAPFLALAFCQAGGLPRDLIRSTLRMCASAEAHSGPEDEQTGLSLDEIARELVHRDLTGKTEAVTAAIRSLGVEPAVSQVLSALQQLDSCEPPLPRRVPCLLDDDWLGPLGRLDRVVSDGAAGEDLAELKTLRRLSVELVGYFYFCRTLLELFDVGSEASIDRLIKAVDDPEGRALRELVRARQNFAVNPFLAWEQVTQFRVRKEIGLRAFPLPAALAPAAPAPSASAPAALADPNRVLSSYAAAG